MSNVVIIILILAFFGAFGAAPQWGWHTAGWAPSTGLGLLFLVLIILLITGKL